MRGPAVLEVAAGDQSVLGEVVLVDLLAFGVVVEAAAHQVQVAIGRGDGFVELGHIECGVDLYGREVDLPALQVQQVQDVFVVLEEVQILLRTALLEGVHADDAFLGPIGRTFGR